MKIVQDVVEYGDWLYESGMLVVYNEQNQPPRIGKLEVIDLDGQPVSYRTTFVEVAMSTPKNTNASYLTNVAGINDITPLYALLEFPAIPPEFVVDYLLSHGGYKLLVVGQVVILEPSQFRELTEHDRPTTWGTVARIVDPWTIDVACNTWKGKELRKFLIRLDVRHNEYQPCPQHGVADEMWVELPEPATT